MWGPVLAGPLLPHGRGIQSTPMLPAVPNIRALFIGAGLLMLAGGVWAQQQGPVAAMFGADQKRDPSFAASFTAVDVPATAAAGFPLHVYLSAGDLERAFDRAEFRPDAAIVPTNT